jgi:hypothetical protein
MKRPALAGLVLVVLAVLVFRQLPGFGTHTVKYLGQEFRMSKAFRSYEDYKDEPNNLATNELGRIESAITNAPFPSRFESQTDLARAVIHLRFPGYGCGGAGVYAQSDGTTCSVFFVEIPMTAKERVFVGRTSGREIAVVDDFVLSLGTNEISRVKIDGTRIQYYDREGGLLREKQM